MDNAKACELINAQIDKIDSLLKQSFGSPEFKQWKSRTEVLLRKLFGDDSKEVKDFESIKYYFWGEELDNSVLEKARALLKSAVYGIQTFGIESTCIGTKAKAINVFISHGNQSEALNKTEKFIRAFGFEPVIVKDKASEGKAVDDLVDEKMQGCQCAIILATKDDQVDGYYQPRPNVLHEVGKAQSLYSDKITYLKEVGCQFPSNFAPKVWEDFTQDNMEAAFLKIVKEFKASGFI